MEKRTSKRLFILILILLLLTSTLYSQEITFKFPNDYQVSYNGIGQIEVKRDDNFRFMFGMGVGFTGAILTTVVILESYHLYYK